MQTHAETNQIEEDISKSLSNAFYTQERLTETILGTTTVLDKLLGRGHLQEASSAQAVQNPKSSMQGIRELDRNATTSPKERESEISEEILAWWQGVVVKNFKDSFDAEMTDLEGRQNIVEIEKKSVGHSQQGNICTGARFVYSITRVDKPEGAVTSSSIQFLPPVIWTRSSEDYIEKRINELYEDDSTSFTD
jgi:hypothetical protein